MIVSPAGRALIERNEGLRLDAYPDPISGGDPWTIGYGDTGPDVVPGLRITQEEAERRLTNRLERDFGRNVNEEIGSAPTTQGQFDAMVSLAYNIGNGGTPGRHGNRGFDGSTVLREHLAGNYAAAADAFLLWNKAGGRVVAALTRRRREERALYLSDVPAADPATLPPGDNLIEQMKVIQRALVRSSDYRHPDGRPGVIDGDPGPLTRRALHAYRGRRGI